MKNSTTTRNHFLSRFFSNNFRIEKGKPIWVLDCMTGKVTSRNTKEDYLFMKRFAWGQILEDSFGQDGRILVASHDMYEPFELKLLDDGLWEWDVFGREESQSSQFDVLAANLNKTLLPLTVNHLAILDTGDLRIGFDENVSFETFITYSRKYEFYRLIDFNTDEHYVVFDGE